MKAIVTGASGLLGSDICYSGGKRGLELIKLCRVPRNGFTACDITTKEGLRCIDSLEWDVIVHAAAMKNPDECEEKREETYKINVEATENLACIASAKKAKMFYISTDYVFPGDDPPYMEDSATCPINYYGETKLAGEKVVLEKCEDACVIRVPFLYGIRAGLKASAMLYSSLKALSSPEQWPMEDSLVRYPTYTGEVAEALMFLLEKDARGIYHFSGDDKLTRYGIVKVISEVTGMGMGSIEHLAFPPPTPARRPHDARLGTNKIKSLGLPFEIIPFRERNPPYTADRYLSVE